MIAGRLRDIVRISPWRSVNDGLKVAGIVLLENGTAGFLIEVRRTYKKR